MAQLYLVTGATGFLGGHVVSRLLARGQRVRVLVLPDDPTAPRIPQGVEVVTGDVLDQDSLRAFFRSDGGDEMYVVHCASMITMSWEVTERAHAVNVDGTRNIIRCCLEQHVNRLVYVSSVHAIPEKPDGEVITEVEAFDPGAMKGAYATTKAEASQAVMDGVHRDGLHASIVHPSGLLGPGDTQGGYLTQMLIDYDQGRIPAGVRGGYSFADVRDVAEAIIACLDHGRDGAGYILDGHYVTIRQIFEVLHRDLGMKKTRVYFPLWVARLFLPLFTLEYALRGQKPVFSSYSLYTLGGNGSFSSARARRELAFEPRPYAETIADAVRWLRGEGRIRPQSD